MRGFVLCEFNYAIIQGHCRTDFFSWSRMALNTGPQVFIELGNLRGNCQAHALICFTIIGGACYI
ncbi:hypothetical protein AXF42_Ash010917 [Apostasia shenzhenica]|uniref:Uncharacterized protein n=1 Tax=Apostasia shenzhenica TaxID=1088818 RepID=A0A2H9ZQL1_9ASPA|nr:hypothetical protein AXF42_Ash010917 [Apostasia shenzhenica]